MGADSKEKKYGNELETNQAVTGTSHKASDEVRVSEQRIIVELRARSRAHRIDRYLTGG